MENTTNFPVFLLFCCLLCFFCQLCVFVLLHLLFIHSFSFVHHIMQSFLILLLVCIIGSILAHDNDGYVYWVCSCC